MASMAVQGKHSALLKVCVLVDSVLRLLESYYCMTFPCCVKLIAKERSYTSPITRDFHILSPILCIVPHVSCLVADTVAKTFCGWGTFRRLLTTTQSELFQNTDAHVTRVTADTTGSALVQSRGFLCKFVYTYHQHNIYRVLFIKITWLQIQFGAPDDERCAARDMLSLQ
jgi:hypothetical protein